MNTTVDAIDFVRFCQMLEEGIVRHPATTTDYANYIQYMSRRGYRQQHHLVLPTPTTHTRVSSGPNVPAEEESPAVIIHNQETVTSSSNQAREERRILDLPPGYEEAVRGMREPGDDPPSYKAVCLPSEETGAPPPYEVVSRDSAHNEREGQPTESRGLPRIEGSIVAFGRTYSITSTCLSKLITLLMLILLLLLTIFIIFMIIDRAAFFA